MSKKQKRKSTQANSYDELIEPFIKRGEEVRGFIAEVTRQVSIILGKEIARQQVDAWMCPDRKERVEPCYSTATALFGACLDASKIIMKREYEKTTNAAV